MRFQAGVRTHAVACDTGAQVEAAMGEGEGEVAGGKATGAVMSSKGAWPKKSSVRRHRRPVHGWEQDGGSCWGRVLVVTPWKSHVT